MMGVYLGSDREGWGADGRLTTVHPGTVRPINYEIVPRTTAENIGPEAVATQLAALTHVAVVRCVDDHGRKLTAIGDAGHLQALLRSGEASDPHGMRLQRAGFPVVLAGWRQAN